MTDQIRKEDESNELVYTTPTLPSMKAMIKKTIGMIFNKNGRRNN